ncbi:hypothetical protein ACC771_08620, partial [Rhizobium ruizarguesonis]
RASDPGIFKLIRGVTFDEYQRLVPRTFEPMPVHVIDIDEASLHEFGHASSFRRAFAWMKRLQPCPARGEMLL